jgi:hypothetical protein
VFLDTPAAVSITAGRKREYADVHRDITIERNRVTTTRAVAFDIRSTRGAVVRDNIIKAPGKEPIAVSLSSDVSIEANQHCAATAP